MVKLLLIFYCADKLVMSREIKKYTECNREKKDYKRHNEMSLAFYTERGEGKTDNLSKQDALIQICSLRQQIPCETLRLICGEAGTNAHSTVSKQHTKKISLCLSVHECEFILLLSHLMTNAYCHCHWCGVYSGIQHLVIILWKWIYILGDFYFLRVDNQKR